MTLIMVSIDELLDDARSWLDGVVARRPTRVDLEWGQGSDDVSLFRNMTFEEERDHIDEYRDWQRAKSDASYGSIDWPVEYGGAGLSPEHASAFRRLEREYDTPAIHEAIGITMNLIAPTILVCGTNEQRSRYIEPMRRLDEMWCQLFSEPEAGSDLASLRMSAVRDGDDWVLDGQKVWTSGAQYADFGYCLAHTDPDIPRHGGITAFIFPMDAEGVEVRPLRQMSGGSSFNEVFLDGVRIPDSQRLGEVGGGWNVAITTLGFERVAASGGGGAGAGHIELLRLLVAHLGVGEDPLVRQRLARVITNDRIRSWTLQRSAASAVANGGIPGPEGSLGKLLWTNNNTEIAELASMLLGPALVADSGEWGTYAWADFVLGAPGYRIAGGTDEIQRNIIGERVLGLPREPRPG